MTSRVYAQAALVALLWRANAGAQEPRNETLSLPTPAAPRPPVSPGAVGPAASASTPGVPTITAPASAQTTPSNPAPAPPVANGAGPAPSASASLPSSLAEALRSARHSRCQTAICWGPEDDFAIEPLAELPLGKSISVSSQGGLSDYINNSDFSATLTAGIRFWFLKDYASVSAYLSRPVAAASKVRLRGSEYEYPSSSIKRPYPGVALGLFGDVLWLGFDVDELRNGDSETERDRRYYRDATVSRSFTMTFGFAPISLIRNGLGLKGDKKLHPLPLSG